jgi:hypothetical protein
MIRNQLVVANLIAIALLGGASFSSTPAAYALPHFGLHQHLADPNDTRVNMQVYNKGETFRDVKIEGRIYTLLPHQYLNIKAPEGTGIYTNSTGSLHRKGDLLFSVDRSMKNKVLTIN